MFSGKASKNDGSTPSPNPTSGADPDCVEGAPAVAVVSSSLAVVDPPASPPVDKILEGTLMEAVRAPIMLLVRADKFTGGSLLWGLSGKRLDENPW